MPNSQKSLFAKLSALWKSIALLTDGKTYGFKNGTLVEIGAKYDSGWLTTTSAASGILPHLLGNNALDLTVELRVATTFAGLAVGTIIPISILYDANLRPSAFWYDAININYKLCNDSAVFSWANPATGASMAIVNTNVQWRVRAKVF